MPDEYAEDVTDLRQAQRIIARLRKSLIDLEEMSHPVEGEFTAFLDREHTEMLETLYRIGKLYEGQDEEEELLEAFSEFVSNWLDVQWDLVRDDPDEPSLHITASA